MRKKLFKLHSYFALIALVPVIIVSLTGSILVFKTEIDQSLMPGVAALEYHKVSDKGFSRQNINNLLKNIESSFPEYIVGAWEIFDDGKEADRVYLIKKGTDDWHKIYFDPYDNRVLSEPALLNSYLTDWLLELHYTFLLNGIGGEDSQWGTLIGLITALFLTFLGVSGLVLHRKFWLQLLTLRINKSKRVVYGDLHRLVGAWSSPIILILGVTGIYFNAVGYYHVVFEHGDEEHYTPLSSLYSKNTDFEFLLKDSLSQLEGFTPTYLLFPHEPEVNITVFGYLPSANIFSSNYSSTVTYHRVTSELIAAVDGREAGAVTQVFDSFRELHFGSFAGLGSKILWCIFGLAPFILSITGLTIWLLRRQIKKRRIFDKAILDTSSPA